MTKQKNNVRLLRIGKLELLQPARSFKDLCLRFTDCHDRQQCAQNTHVAAIAIAYFAAWKGTVCFFRVKMKNAVATSFAWPTVAAAG